MVRSSYFADRQFYGELPSTYSQQKLLAEGSLGAAWYIDYQL
jgi:hypothetical protein